MPADGFPLVCPTDGAEGFPNGQAHRALPEDAALNGGDHVRRGVRPGHVAPQDQDLVPLLALHLGGVDPGGLGGGAPLVVLEHRQPHKLLRHLLQRSGGEALMVPVHLLAAGCQLKDEHLFGAQRPQGLLVDEKHVHLRGRDALFDSGGFQNLFHDSSPSGASA